MHYDRTRCQKTCHYEEVESVVKKAKIYYLQMWADSLDGHNERDVTLFFKLLKLDSLEKEMRNRLNPVNIQSYNSKCQRLGLN